MRSWRLSHKWSTALFFFCRILGKQGEYVGEGYLTPDLRVVRFRKPNEGTWSTRAHTIIQLLIYFVAIL